MSGGTAMVVGHALQGLGSGLASYGATLREGKLAALKRQSDDRRIADDRAFRSSEAQKGRDFTATQNDLSRTARADLQDDAQAHTTEITGAKLDAEAPLNDARVKNIDASTRLSDARVKHLEEGGGLNSASVQSRNQLKKIYMGSVEGQQGEAESDEAYQQRVNSWLIEQETQKAGTPASEMRLKVWRELKDTRVPIVQDGKNRTVDFAKLPVDEQLRHVDSIIEKMRGPSVQSGQPLGLGASTIPTVTNQAEYDALPSGAQFRDPQGNLRTKK